MHSSDLQKKYPHEWVLIEYDELDEDLKVKEGHVIAHSANKDDIYKALNRAHNKNVAIEYAGPLVDDLIVMF